MATSEQVELAREYIESVERQLAKWRLWFPREDSEVTVERNALLSLVAVAKQALPSPPAAPSPDITPEWLLEVGGMTQIDGSLLYFQGLGGEYAMYCSQDTLVIWQEKSEIRLQNLTRDRFRALCEGLGIKLKGEAK
jgi:hypothetical protein